MTDTDASETRRIGVVALARPTFDVALAEEVAGGAFAALQAMGAALVGPRELLFDADAVRGALATLQGEALDLLLVLQVTFTDATMTVELAHAIDAPLMIWAFPEARTGRRLRLNSFCGLNLAAHALGLIGRDPAFLFAAPDKAELVPAIEAAVAGRRADPPGRLRRGVADDAGERVATRLTGARIGLVGRHPDGFDTCRFDDDDVMRRFGAEVPRARLDTLFRNAGKIEDARAAAVRARVDAELEGADAVDQAQLDRSCRLFAALEDVVEAKSLDALAVRCWPEAFTEYGCAACGPMAMLTQDGVPAACEADVWGAITSLMMAEAAGSPAWLVDVVDLDDETDTGVVWHCGLAPLEMADPEASPKADLHSNRKMPLLGAFPLKPGRITLARLSQARGEAKLVLIGAEVLRAADGAPAMSFSGTSGIVRFDIGAGAVRDAIVGHALEHHVSIVYGDVRPTLRAAAAALDLPVLDVA